MKEIIYEGFKFKEPIESDNPRMQDHCHSIVASAISKGIINRGSCEVCNTTINIDSHHEDYREPLIVRWLCHKHHLKVHGLFKIKVDRTCFLI